MKKTSLKDIAQSVGVSTALVSYVLNNKKENRISKEVAQKIREVAKALNYRPNQIAKSLKTSKTNTLGLIVADIANPFFSSLARIIEDEADKANYTVIFGSSDENPQKCRKLITTLLNRQVDGLIIAPPAGTESQLLDLQRQGVPFVLVDRYFPALKTNYVALDNFQAMYMGVQQLIDSGYQRIGLVTFKTPLFHIHERTRGYQSALNDHSIDQHEDWVQVVDLKSLTSDVNKAIAMLTTGPDPVEAILFTTNTLSLCGLKYIKTLPIRVPDDLAVVCFDETEAYDLFYTPLPYIKQPSVEIGQQATQLLINALTTADKLTRINLKASLVLSYQSSPLPSLTTISRS